ncbi:MAG: hypothetical protein AB7P17_13855 [Nitrospirales bacterium]|nr:hypothetical protein [Nitrospirales bacterium]
MKSLSKFTLFASFSLMAFTLGCAEMNTGSGDPAGTAASSPSSTSNQSAVNTGPNRVSTGVQGDTLEACISRIPSNSSESQRMFATLSCERDAKVRSPIDAVPGK